ncbi:hypothetical protein SRB17_85260 [Streptomyces sp. RB17]|nr:hypothetical protein [Streptomyces sp. RB17]
MLADLVDADGVLPEIQPGVLFDGDDLGRWLEQRRNPGTWAQLSAKQQERLSRQGVTPAKAPSPAPAAVRSTKSSGKAQQAFQRGLAAYTQYVRREGHPRVPRNHLERITLDGQEHEVKLGIWVSNTTTKSRWDKLTPEQRTALTTLRGGRDAPPPQAPAPVPRPAKGPASAHDEPVQPTPPDAQVQDHQDDTTASHTAEKDEDTSSQPTDTPPRWNAVWPMSFPRSSEPALSEKERQANIARIARMHRVNELVRHHTKDTLLTMAYEGGLSRDERSEKWRKEGIANAIVDIELRAAAQPDPATLLPQQDPHDE